MCKSRVKDWSSAREGLLSPKDYADLSARFQIGHGSRQRPNPNQRGDRVGESDVNEQALRQIAGALAR